MYEDIRKNKIKTGVVIGIFLTMITLIVYYICYAFGYSEFALIIALAFSIISTVLTYYNCDKVVLASVRAREASEEEYAQLNHILDIPFCQAYNTRQEGATRLQKQIG